MLEEPVGSFRCDAPFPAFRAVIQFIKHTSPFTILQNICLMNERLTCRLERCPADRERSGKVTNKRSSSNINKSYLVLYIVHGMFQLDVHVTVFKCYFLFRNVPRKFKSNVLIMCDEWNVHVTSLKHLKRMARRGEHDGK